MKYHLRNKKINPDYKKYDCAKEELNIKWQRYRSIISASCLFYIYISIMWKVEAIKCQWGKWETQENCVF